VSSSWCVCHVGDVSWSLTAHARVRQLLSSGALRSARGAASGTARDVAIACKLADVAAVLERADNAPAAATTSPGTATPAAAAATAATAAASGTLMPTSGSSNAQSSSAGDDESAPSSSSSGGGAGGGGHYQTFDPSLRIAPTIKLRAIFGDDADLARAVGVTLNTRDTVAQCMVTVCAGCDLLLPAAFDRAAYSLYKRRPDGSFVELPSARKLLAAGFDANDFVFLRPSAASGVSTANAVPARAPTALDDVTPAPRRKAPTRLDPSSPATGTAGTGSGNSPPGATSGMQSAAGSSPPTTSSALSSSPSGAAATAATSPAATSVATNNYGTLPHVQTRIVASPASSATPAASQPVAAAVRALPSAPTKTPSTTAPLTTPAAAAAKPAESKRVRMSKKVLLVGSIADVWAVMGDFLDLRWTGIEPVCAPSVCACDHGRLRLISPQTVALSADDVTSLALSGLGGSAATELADGMRGATAGVVGCVREFRHPGSTRPIRHRCVAMCEPATSPG
jgi:hypothetical protein